MTQSLTNTNVNRVSSKSHNPSSSRGLFFLGLICGAKSSGQVVSDQAMTSGQEVRSDVQGLTSREEIWVQESALHVEADTLAPERYALAVEPDCLSWRKVRLRVRKQLLFRAAFSVSSE